MANTSTSMKIWTHDFHRHSFHHWISIYLSMPTMHMIKSLADRLPEFLNLSFGAEFTALKKAVEEVITLRYYLRSMGIQVNKVTPIYVDNMGVVLNASNLGSTLNKKSVALSYHFVREHVANDVIEIRKIDSADNFADPFTKALTSNEHHDFFYEVTCN